MTEYHVRITWDETPTGEENIEKYILYRKERKLRTNKTANNEKIGEVAAGKERVWKIITRHCPRNCHMKIFMSTNHWYNTSYHLNKKEVFLCTFFRE